MRRLDSADPKRIGSTDLLAVIGDGSMGRVYLGRSQSGRLLAVKVVRRELAHDPAFRERFAREVAAVGQVSGAFSAPVVETDPEAPTPWLSTAFIAGPTLRSAVAERGAMSEGDVLHLAAGLAEGLRAIHGAGLVHRDLKPANILLDADGPRVIDFGVARGVDASGTTTGQAMAGTASFMAPEQSDGGAVTPAADVWALGGVLCFAATGRAPFGSDAVPAVVYRAATLPPDLRGVPGRVAELAAACLHKDPQRRPGPERILSAAAPAGATWPPEGVSELIARHEQEARAILTGERTARTRRRLLLAGGAAALTVVLTAAGIGATQAGLVPGMGAPDAGASPTAVTSRDAVEGDVRPAPAAGAAFHPGVGPRDLVEALFVPERGKDGTAVTALHADATNPDRLHALGLRYSEEWNLATGEQTMPKVPMKRTEAFAFDMSPDGRRVAAGTEEGKVYVGAPGGSRPTWTGDAPDDSGVDSAGSGGAVTDLVFSRDGSTLAVSFEGGGVNLYDARSGDEKRTLRPVADDGKEPTAWVLAANPRRDEIAVSLPREVRLLDSTTGEEIDRYKPEGNSDYAMEYTPDGAHMVTGGLMGHAQVLDARTGKSTADLRAEGKNFNVMGVATTPDGRVAATVLPTQKDYKGPVEIRLWDTRKGTSLGALKAEATSGPHAPIEFTSDGKRLVFGQNNGAIRVWSLRD